jgi:glucose/arabinose dehydrogenase
MDNLSKNSICGKILLVNTDTKKYEIFSSGHRNIIGMYSDENVILATEHGPFAGDEINNIKKGSSYGWPVASYGENYSRGQSNEIPNYKKSHKKNNFSEPIFSFLPAIGISEIIKLSNNFSEMWQDNFLIGSLNGKYLYRVKFDEMYEKILYYEKIFIGDRIRDIIYENESNDIYLSLELNGTLGILSKVK